MSRSTLPSSSTARLCTSSARSLLTKQPSIVSTLFVTSLSALLVNGHAAFWARVRERGLRLARICCVLASEKVGSRLGAAGDRVFQTIESDARSATFRLIKLLTSIGPPSWRLMHQRRGLRSYPLTRSRLFSSCVVCMRSLVQHPHVCTNRGCCQGRRLHDQFIFDLGQIHFNFIADALLPAIFKVEKHVFADVPLSACGCSFKLAAACVCLFEPGFELFIELPVFLL